MVKSLECPLLIAIDWLSFAVGSFEGIARVAVL